jgi:dihydrofolate reductase
VSLDGYVSSANGDFSWAHRKDPEFNAFVEDERQKQRRARFRENHLSTHGELLGRPRLPTRTMLSLDNLIDEYQIVLNPVVLGAGRTMFEGVRERLSLKLAKARTFANGNVWLSYGSTV